MASSGYCFPPATYRRCVCLRWLILVVWCGCISPQQQPRTFVRPQGTFTRKRSLFCFFLFFISLFLHHLNVFKYIPFDLLQSFDASSSFTTVCPRNDLFSHVAVEFGQLNCVFNSYYWKCVFIHVLLVFCFCLREIRCTSIIVCGRLTEDADRNKNTHHSFTYLEVLNLHITTFQLNTKPLKYPFYINFKLWWVEASFRGLLHRWPDSWIASANILEASLNVKSWTIRIRWMNNNANNHTGDDDSPRTQNHMAKAKTKYIQNIIVFQFLYDRPQSINLWHIKW